MHMNLMINSKLRSKLKKILL